MNVVLWVLQGALALLLFAGGGYKAANPDDVARPMSLVVALIAYGRYSLSPLA